MHIILSFLNNPPSSKESEISSYCLVGCWEVNDRYTVVSPGICLQHPDHTGSHTHTYRGDINTNPALMHQSKPPTQKFSNKKKKKTSIFDRLYVFSFSNWLYLLHFPWFFSCRFCYNCIHQIDKRLIMKTTRNIKLTSLQWQKSC